LIKKNGLQINEKDKNKNNKPNETNIILTRKRSSNNHSKILDYYNCNLDNILQNKRNRRKKSCNQYKILKNKKCNASFKIIIDKERENQLMDKVNFESDESTCIKANFELDESTYIKVMIKENERFHIHLPIEVRNN